MHSRNFCTDNNAQAPHTNNNQMSYSSNNNTVANKAILNPFADDHSNVNNSYSGMTHNDNGLRAASHVSMEHTIDAHEYQPTCKCSDCQDVVKNFTNFSILDAYVTSHLSYESRINAEFGFVPCIGGQYGHIAMRTVTTNVYDEQTGEVIGQEQTQTPVPSNSYVFHMHLHHMKPVPKDYKERSYARFFAPKEAVSIPAPNSKRHNNNNNNSYRGGNKNMNNNNNNYHSQNYNNYYGGNTNSNQQQAVAAPSYSNNNQSFNQHHFPNYTQADVEQATAASNYTHGAARLGN